jgi:VIT family protein
MPEHATNSFKPVLEPMERISEILFGLVMVLTLTCSLSVATAGQEEVRTVLLSALGCNLAWGIIDGVFYLLACFSERGRGIVALRAVCKSAEPSEAHRIIADAMPPLLSSVLSPTEFEVMRQRLNQLPEPPTHPRLTKDNWIGAFAVFLLVFFSTLPVVVPFIFIDHARVALQVSNGIAIAMLFLTGYAFGRYAGHRPWWMGVSMIIVGVALVGISRALGG